MNLLLTLNLMNFFPFFETVHYHCQGYQDENLKMVTQQYSIQAFSDCMEVQARLALYWWQRLNTFGSSNIRQGKFVM